MGKVGRVGKEVGHGMRVIKMQRMKTGPRQPAVFLDVCKSVAGAEPKETSY